MLDDITDMSGYLKTYGRSLADKIKQGAEPLYQPGDTWSDKLYTLLREPYQAQGDAIMGFTICGGGGALVGGIIGTVLMATVGRKLYSDSRLQPSGLALQPFQSTGHHAAPFVSLRLLSLRF